MAPSRRRSEAHRADSSALDAARAKERGRECGTSSAGSSARPTSQSSTSPSVFTPSPPCHPLSAFFSATGPAALGVASVLAGAGVAVGSGAGFFTLRHTTRARAISVSDRSMPAAKPPVMLIGAPSGHAACLLSTPPTCWHKGSRRRRRRRHPPPRRRHRCL